MRLRTLDARQSRVLAVAAAPFHGPYLARLSRMSEQRILPAFDGFRPLCTICQPTTTGPIRAAMSGVLRSLGRVRGRCPDDRDVAYGQPHGAYQPKEREGRASQHADAS